MKQFKTLAEFFAELGREVIGRRIGGRWEAKARR